MRNYIKYCLGGFLIFSLFSCSGTSENNEENNSGTIQTGSMNTGNGTGDTGNTLSGSGEDEIFGKDFSSTVTGENISSGELLGYYAKPKTEGSYPGIVMIHEWWGLNDEIKYMADLLANDGYRVFAVDLYSGSVATDQTKAQELSGQVRSNTGAALKKMELAYDYLKKNGNENDKIASLGWCFGGQQSLNLSLNEKLNATIIYYGTLETDKEKLRNISGPVLGIFGQEDQSVKVDSVNKFKDSLNELGVKNDIYIYAGVGHAFANPTGNNFSKPASIDAWDKTLQFLNDNLKK